MASHIFINYRRADSANAAGRLYDRLEAHYGKEHLFMDVDQIAGGVDFVDELNRQLSKTDVLIAVIGPNWVTIKDENSEDYRLNNPDDFVRIEIERALQIEIEIIPVLVDGAAMPQLVDLPESMKPLSRRNAMRLTHERFRADSQGLIHNIDAALVRMSERLKEKQLKEKAEAETKKLKKEQEQKEKLRSEATAGLNSDQIEAAEAIANWEFIKNNSDPEDFRNHIARYASHQASMTWALGRLDESVWNATIDENTSDMFAAYIEEFPNGKYREIAQTNLIELRRDAKIQKEKDTLRLKETAAWDALKDTDDPLLLESFLIQFPDSQDFDEAKRLLKALGHKNFLRNNKVYFISLLLIICSASLFIFYQNFIFRKLEIDIRTDVIKSASCRIIDNYNDCENTLNCEWLLSRNICEARKETATINSPRNVTSQQKKASIIYGNKKQSVCKRIDNYNACETKNNCDWILSRNICLEKTNSKASIRSLNKQPSIGGKICQSMDNYNDCEARNNCNWHLSRNICENK